MRFTVLTATYNRAHLLEGVYRSLCSQTFPDFEWVIVDDGSTDGTRELVASWKSFFPIRYTWKPNGGKHTAINIGVQQAAGEFVLIFDSDDRCVPRALERFDCRWKRISEPDRFAFLVGLCYQKDGITLHGSPLPADCVDVFTAGESMALCAVDRWGMVRADVFRKFPFPVFQNERFIPEGTVWNRIMKEYGARFFNEPLLIACYAPGGLGRQGDLRFSSPKGAVVYHAELALAKVPVNVRIKSAINTLRFSFVALARELRLFR